MQTKTALVHEEMASSKSVPASSPADSPRLLAAIPRQFFAQGDPRQAGYEASRPRAAAGPEAAAKRPRGEPKLNMDFVRVKPELVETPSP